MLKPFAGVDSAVRAEIEELVYLHAWLLDHGFGEQIVELYTEDGVMVGVGPDRIGRASVLEYARGRKPTRTARHVCSNLRVTYVDATRMSGTCMIALYRSDDHPPRDATPIALADIDDEYRLCGDGRWRIGKRSVSIVFEADTHRSQQAAPPA